MKGIAKLSLLNQDNWWVFSLKTLSESLSFRFATRKEAVAFMDQVLDKIF